MEFLWVYQGHVKFYKTYKDVNLIVVSQVSCVSMLVTLLYPLKSESVYLAALLQYFECTVNFLSLNTRRIFKTLLLAM